MGRLLALCDYAALEEPSASMPDNEGDKTRFRSGMQVGRPDQRLSWLFGARKHVDGSLDKAASRGFSSSVKRKCAFWTSSAIWHFADGRRSTAICFQGP
jgi:hypothetical protein